MTVENIEASKPEDQAKPDKQAEETQEVEAVEDSADLEKELADWKAKAQAAEETEKKLTQALAQLEEKTTQFNEISHKLEKIEKDAQAKAWRAQVADEFKVPAEALRGDTLEELKAHGAQLQELLKPKAAIARGIEREPESGSLTANSAKAFLDLLRNR